MSTILSSDILKKKLGNFNMLSTLHTRVKVEKKHPFTVTKDTEFSFVSMTKHLLAELALQIAACFFY